MITNIRSKRMGCRWNCRRNTVGRIRGDSRIVGLWRFYGIRSYTDDRMIDRFCVFVPITEIQTNRRQTALWKYDTTLREPSHYYVIKEGDTRFLKCLSWPENRSKICIKMITREGGGWKLATLWLCNMWTIPFIWGRWILKRADWD